MIEDENLSDPEARQRLRTCRLLIKERKRIGAHLGFDLCPDPAWDMLLDLYVAHHEKRSITIWSLCLASNIPTSTAHRKIGEMIETGIMMRGSQGGRVTVSIAPGYLPRLNALLDDLAILGEQGWVGSERPPSRRGPLPGPSSSPDTA
jgi:hypothetical protein